MVGWPVGRPLHDWNVSLMVSDFSSGALGWQLSQGGAG